ncbi:MAG: MOSC domain-containing protein [Dehalococcoidia bacterium]|nr:MOSC domain-containing protein [Dehalococcoidia bacterium]
MITVKEIAIAPVKATALVLPTSVRVAERGIVEDRRFLIINGDGRMVTSREVGALALVRAVYQPEPERLTLVLPDGRKAEGPVTLGEPAEGLVFRTPFHGCVLAGAWNSLLSNFCGQPLRIVRTDAPGQCVDIAPVSLLSEASVDELNRRGSEHGSFESARFRPNLLLSGCAPHEEDEWVGQRVCIGKELVVRVSMRDARCAQTNLNPRTGKNDADTLRALASYRREDGKVWFGIYASVERPGVVRVGDEVRVG